MALYKKKFASPHLQHWTCSIQVHCKKHILGRRKRWQSRGTWSSPPPQTHQNYIYKWNNSHRIPTESLQKISYNQSYKKNSQVTTAPAEGLKYEPITCTSPWHGGEAWAGSCAGRFASTHACLKDLWAHYEHFRSGCGPSRAAPTTDFFVGVHTKWQAASQSCMSQCTAPGEEHAVASFSEGVLPVPPTSHHSLEPDLGASTPTTGEQTLTLTGLWQPPEQRGGPTQHPVQALVTTTPNTSPIRGTRASTTWGKSWQASIPQTALTLKILHSHSLHKGHSHCPIKTDLQDHSR